MVLDSETWWFGASLGQLIKASACRELSLTVRCSHLQRLTDTTLGVRLPLAGFARDLILHDRQFDVGLFESDLAAL